MRYVKWKVDFLLGFDIEGFRGNDKFLGNDKLVGNDKFLGDPAF